MRFARWLLVLFVVCFSVSCRSAQHGPAKIAVSMQPLDDLVRRIAGPDAEVTLVLPPGISPRAWSPTPDAASRVADAKLLVTVGLGLDGWMDTLAASVAPKARLLRVGDRVPTITSAGGEIAPEVWMDPQRARLLATAIAEEMARADRSHANDYRARASQLDAALASLDRELEGRTAAWGGKVRVPEGAGMAYYAERYGLSFGPPRPTGQFDTQGQSSYEALLRSKTAALEASAP